MKKLKKPCSTCGRPIKLTWTVCPYCRAKQSPAEMEAGTAVVESRPRPKRQRAEAAPEQA
jgi:predicted amidophosphoribosyltransferase